MDDPTKWALLVAKHRQIETAEVAARFRLAGIEPVVLKGFCAARFYPPDRPRAYTDVDVAVPACDYARAFRYKNTDDMVRLMIDLHGGIAKLDSKPWEDFFEDTQLIDIDGTPVRIPSDEDNLRILCTHWLNNGGLDKERLRDVLYAVENRRSDFDWDKCFAPVGANRRGWVIACISLANRYFGLKVDDLPFADEIDRLPDWIPKFVENAWANPYASTPVSSGTVLRSPSRLYKEIRYRFPPNPLQSIAETDGDIYAHPRLSQAKMFVKGSVRLAWRLRLLLPIRRHG